MKATFDPIRSRFASFRYGFLLPAHALRTILRQPPLLVQSAIPVAISVALYAFVALRAQAAARDWVRGFLAAHGWGAQAWAAVVVQGVVVVALLLFSAVTFSIVTSILASPFNDFLAESAERYGSPPLPPTPSLRLAGRARLIAIDLAKTLAALLAGGVALVVSWVPVINALALMLTCLLVTFQYVSYPQTRRGQGLLYGMAFLWRHLFACLGFGAATMLIFAIPFLSVLVLPVAVVGGTLLAARAQGGEFPLR